MALITMENLAFFHTMERTLFKIMVLTLRRDPMQSLHLIALWSWLEEGGFSGMAERISSLTQNSINIINSVADEGVLCLQCMFSNTASPLMVSIPLTKRLMGKNMSRMSITPDFLFERRELALTRMKKLIGDVLFHVLEDIIQQATFSIVNPRNIIPRGFGLGARPVIPNTMLSPYVYRRGGGNGGRRFEVGESSSSPSFRRQITKQLQIEDRTLFSTFSRGYPLTVEEVYNFFTKRYGNCVESVVMEHDPPPPRNQALYAKVVLHEVWMAKMILSGGFQGKVKHIVNGKHMHIRQYERR